MNTTDTQIASIKRFNIIITQTTLEKFKPLVGMFKEVGELSYEEWIDSLTNHGFTSTEMLELFTKLVECQLMYTHKDKLSIRYEFNSIEE